MVVAVEEKRKVKEIEPSFRKPDDMTEEELSDPDYRLKQLMKQNGAHPMTCSKCHHCR